MKIKICGITTSDDALAAIECGADAVGFVFVRSSPRFITAERAAEICAALPRTTMTVGVFVNEPRESVVRTIHTSGLRAVQFHGEEPPEAVHGFGVPVIKAHRLSGGFNPAILERFAVYAHLFDAMVEGAWGGTGRQCDWGEASRAARRSRVILSGGLHPENVEMAIQTVRPFAVDVSSGVEKRPGVKDHEKMRAFTAAARRAFALEHIS
jgi:phosphoribosylanthranilate isomerase